ncbi:Holliday junction resolvase-like protein [Microcystis aeruginosa CS-564/01]|uniref:Holliday junction resolvase-like protein n=1 Tax=Microcystis aeruginosa TaxID=1126 RepID=UPI00232A7AEA|nr:Holliday junction resolvase-like protein [Microcystis aeruginosa]MDB9423430.1 Holliday junction resolvase-like protein [Microcystis aeruginosa CS-564/01]
MEILVSLLLGIIIGSAVTYYVLQKINLRKTVREYETQIQVLKEQHQQALKDARNRSLDGSRAVIKGKIAEQLAPVLPNFKYLPSDARFIGDPIDYVVFNGYTDIKDNGGNENNLEVVILDVKTGQANLSQLQQAIAKAINAGRVRFEVVRPETSKQEGARDYDKSSEEALPKKSYSIKDIQKTHPRAYEPWTKAEDERLRQRYKQGIVINDLAREFQRKPGGIRSRLKKLGLLQ